MINLEEEKIVIYTRDDLRYANKNKSFDEIDLFEFVMRYTENSDVVLFLDFSCTLRPIYLILKCRFVDKKKIKKKLLELLSKTNIPVSGASLYFRSCGVMRDIPL